MNSKGILYQCGVYLSHAVCVKCLQMIISCQNLNPSSGQACAKGVYMCKCAWEGQRSMLGIFHCFPPYFLRQDQSLSLHLTDLARRATSKSGDAPVSVSPVPGSRTGTVTRGHSHRCYGSKLMSSCSCGKHWAVSTIPSGHSSLTATELFSCWLLTRQQSNNQVIYTPKHLNNG